MRYLPVPTENLETIQDEIYSLFPRHLMRKNILHYVDPDYFLEKLAQQEKPNLKSYLEKTECIDYVESMGFLVLQKFHKHSIHIDAMKSAQCSLNIPIKNCKNTYINFYQNNGPMIEQLTANGLKFYEYDHNRCVLIDRAEMSVPHIISLTEPHNVSNENKTVRITFLIRLNNEFDMSSYQKKNSS
jgi:uncharacterized protein YqgQ